ncbi:hypothetical protein Trydic_g16180 [Trypoxylus dichotomus]
MWSKQTETSNKNMTSLKDKITHRKRKGNKSKNAEAVTDHNNVNINNTKLAKKVHKQANLRSKVAEKNSVAAACGKSENTVRVQCKTEEEVRVCVSTLNNKDDVNDLSRITDNSVYRMPLADNETDVKFRNDALTRYCDPNGSVKRYSDSFIIEQNSSSKNSRLDSNLSRARSGFFISETETRDEFVKSGRKSRRFSDIFKYGGIRHSDSCDDLKFCGKMLVQDEVNGNVAEVSLRKPIKCIDMDDKSKKGPKKVNRSDSRNSASTKPKPISKSSKPPENSQITTNSPNNSYLKRVRSKIYRPKSENANVLPSMPEISESVKEKKNKNKKVESKKENESTISKSSVPHIDFRLIRQTSNLESIRPGLLGHKKSISNVGIDSVDGTIEKPVLAKSKSSSAINLNLLRTRRNKLMEQIRKNSKSVQDEFDFISFGGNVGAQMNRRFGSQNLVSSVSEAAYARPTSWLHGHTEWEALKQLKQDESLTIIRADKGNATVIINTEKYKQKIKMLLEPPTYVTRQRDPTSSVIRETSRLVKVSSYYKSGIPTDGV